jgi:hypothetical protein
MLAYLRDLDRWLREWRIVMLNNSSFIFVMAGRRFLKPRPAQLFDEPIPLVHTARYLVDDT